MIEEKENRMSLYFEFLPIIMLRKIRKNGIIHT